MNNKHARMPKAEKPYTKWIDGAITPDEFNDMMREVFGTHRWQSIFARGTGLAPSTVTRYLQGVFPIPRYIALICEMLLTYRRNGMPVPDGFGAEYRD